MTTRPAIARARLSVARLSPVLLALPSILACGWSREDDGVIPTAPGQPEGGRGSTSKNSAEPEEASLLDCECFETAGAALSSEMSESASSGEPERLQASIGFFWACERGVRTMNPIEQLQVRIQDALPKATATLRRRPRRADAMWWLDASLSGHDVTIQWSSKRGFGVSASLLSDGYGEGPEEVFESEKLDDVSARVLELLSSADHTLPPVAVVLQELRARLGMTQEQLAEKLGVQQAAISRLERREEMTLGSLRRYVDALGAELEINVRTPNGDVVRLVSPAEAAEEDSPRSARVTRGALCRHLSSTMARTWKSKTPLRDPERLWMPWARECTTAASARWHLSTDTFDFVVRDSEAVAFCAPEAGLIGLDVGKAQQIADELATDSAWRSEPEHRRLPRLLQLLVAHEVGHLVDEATIRDEPAFADIQHSEARADCVAGWLIGYLGEDRKLGAALFGKLGCRADSCTHPSPEDRMYAFLAGNVLGASERRAGAGALRALVIRCEELEQTKAFYEHLGLRWTTERHGSGPLHYSSNLGGTLLELYPCDLKRPPSRIRWTLRLPNVASALEHLTSSGLMTEAPRCIGQGGRTTAFVVNDPEGNIVELPTESIHSSGNAGGEQNARTAHDSTRFVRAVAGL